MGPSEISFAEHLGTGTLTTLGIRCSRNRVSPLIRDEPSDIKKLWAFELPDEVAILIDARFSGFHFQSMNLELNMKNKWQAVFFDFDGVILDSVDVKTRAFATMFRPYGPEVEKAVVDYHLVHGGVSRFEKFKYYYENLIKQQITGELLEELGNQFNQLVLNEVLEAPFIEGALETLQQLKEQDVPAFVVSGTPQEEIQMIVEKKNLGRYFVEVHGSPRKKHEILEDIVARYEFITDKCLFIGDAMTDYEAARESGIKFLGIVHKIAVTPFPPDTEIALQVVLPTGVKK